MDIPVICGIDEAGRGPVLGPMVVAIACIDDERLLVEIGVKDSKALSRRERESLYHVLIRVLKLYAYRIVEPQVIDEYVMKNALNLLEAEVYASLINEALKVVKVERVYLDSPDPRPERFAAYVRKFVRDNVEVVALNKADREVPVVSAASIIAKAIRDWRIDELKKTYGDFGSGYPSDPRTRMFLREWVRRYGDLPPIARRSWSTVREIMARHRSSRIDEFMNGH